MRKHVIIVVMLLLSTVLLILTMRGRPPIKDILYDTAPGSPFESTNSTSRYVQTKAIAERGTVFLTLDEAKSASPDVAESNGKFFTLFTPGISLLGVPFYLIGKLFGYPQITTYLAVILFSVLNVYLVARLAQLFGAGINAAYLAGFLFIFGTNTFAYAHSFTQHIMSTSMILLALINASEKRTLRKNLEFGIWAGMGLLFDIPNIFMMLPIGLYIFIKHFSVEEVANKYSLSFKTAIVGIALGALPFVALFTWFNYATTGSPTTIAQMVGRSTYFMSAENKKAYVDDNAADNQFEAKTPFQPRLLMNSGYILLLSNERSWFYYSPFVLMGILGFFLLYKRSSLRTFTILSISVVAMNILIYSMFGDPWGGWSFGPRYLIPGAAILSAAFAVAIKKYKNNYFLLPIFFGIICYSIGVSAVGALTTSAVPPKQEAEFLAIPIPYTYDYNLQMINENKLSPIIFNVYLKNSISAKQFVTFFIVAEFAVFIYGFMALVLEKEKELS